MKKLINSKYMKWFRKQYLTFILNQIIKLNNQCCFCCTQSLKTYHSKFISWKELKKVKENMSSKFLYRYIREEKQFQNCNNKWFPHNTNRIAFLKQCLTKLN